MLTESQVLQAMPTDKPRRLFDGLGLYLQVQPNGSKWWRLKFRLRRKERLMSLGVYPNVSLDDARNETVAMRRLISQGIDPVQHRREQRALAEQTAQHFAFVMALADDGSLTLQYSPADGCRPLAAGVHAYKGGNPCR